MPQYFAFYGTLMDGAADADTPSTAGLVRKVGPCRLLGSLRDHGAYPGYFPARPVAAAADAAAGGLVVAELCEILRPEAFAIFDAWENYDPADEAGSMYVRRKLPLAEPAGIVAWVYVSQLPADDPAVPGGDWRAYRARLSD